VESSVLKLPLVAPPFLDKYGIADLSMASAKLRHVVLVLEYTEGNMRWAADELGVNAATLWRWTTKARRQQHGSDE
jgi:DNA-binding protein Fis